MKTACFLACAALLQAQTYQVTSPQGARFSSLPDEKGAVAAAEKALAADPRNSALLLKLAQAQSGIWQDREAVATLTRALEVSPKDAQLCTERGHREIPLFEFAKARADLTRAVELDPKRMDAYYHLGLSNYFLGDFAQAADAFRHALEAAPNTDERINSTNWLYASLRRANQPDEAAKAAAVITPEMKNSSEHTLFYLNLVRFFQGAMPEAQVLPPEPRAGNTDTETEMSFDTVAYGVGNWHLYNHDPAKAEEYFRRVAKGHVWVTWGFIGSELELDRMKKSAAK
jgi:tetratricopeptide (TPR) repeat protein